MAATKTVIQKSNTRAIVKIVGTAAADTATISLATDLLFTDGAGTAEVASSPKANITKVYYSVSSSGDVSVVRNSVPVLKLFGHDTIEGFGLAEQNGSDIVVTFTTSAGGTIILELAKISGYSPVLLDRSGT